MDRSSLFQLIQEQVSKRASEQAAAEVSMVTGLLATSPSIQGLRRADCEPIGLIAQGFLQRQNERVRQQEGCEHHGAMWAQRMRGQIINHSRMGVTSCHGSSRTEVCASNWMEEYSEWISVYVCVFGLSSSLSAWRKNHQDNIPVAYYRSVCSRVTLYVYELCKIQLFFLGHLVMKQFL